MRVLAVLVLAVALSGCGKATGPRLSHPHEPERHYGLTVSPEEYKRIRSTDARSVVDVNAAIRAGVLLGVSDPYTLTPPRCLECIHVTEDGYAQAWTFPPKR